MSDYISREAALEVFCRWCGICPKEKQKPLECDDILGNVLHSLPAADVVEVRHGHWVMFDHAMSMWNVWVCSECGYRRKEGWMHTEAGKKPEAQYCENCMAKMDGSVNDGSN